MFSTAIYVLLVHQNTVLCGNGLTLYQTTIFWAGHKSKHLYATNKMLLKIMISVFDRVENIVKKRENADYQHFLLFSCIQKALSQGR